MAGSIECIDCIGVGIHGDVGSDEAFKASASASEDTLNFRENGHTMPSCSEWHTAPSYGVGAGAMSQFLGHGTCNIVLVGMFVFVFSVSVFLFCFVFCLHKSVLLAICKVNFRLWLVES